MRTNRTIECQTGIYNTDYRLTCHKDGSITVRCPKIVWINNTGILKHENITTKIEWKIRAIKRLFAREELASDQGISIDDILYRM